ncbi:MAG: helicase C-terminal domain-containing protein [Thermoanaerobaculia bacterium]
MIFDETTRTFEISVRELVEEDEIFHRVGFERSRSWRRLALGGEAHRRVLASRMGVFPGYRGEVWVSSEFETPRYRAVVSGRLDGVVEGEQGSWLIEEYKTCSFSAAGSAIFPPEREARARRQLLAYGALWERAGRGRVRTSLVLVDAAGRFEEIRPVAFRSSEVETDLRGLLDAKFDRLEELRREKAARADAAGTLRFPFAEPRPIQKEMMEAIGAAVREGRHLLLQSPTGTGKTAAALFSSLSEAMRKGNRVAFLTAKTLQQNLAIETLRKINDGQFRVLWMRAKEKMCANDRIFCDEDHCRFARDYPVKMARSGLIERLIETLPVLDPDSVFAHARAEEVCPFEVQIELAPRADVFVGDYNYVFEPVTSLRAFGPDELRGCILVVDEAHNLPERARRIYSPALDETDAAFVANLAALSSGEIWSRLANGVEELREFLRSAAGELAEEPGAIAETLFSEESFGDFLSRWDEAMVGYFEWKRDTNDASEDDPVIALHFSVVRFGVVLRFAAGKADFANVVERTAGGIRASMICLDPARALAPILNSAASTILLSATLAPFEVLRRLTGLSPDRTAELNLPPPFPRENRRVLVVSSVRTTFTSRDRNYDKIADLLARMADAHTGNDLALFPSYKFLREVASRLPPMQARVLEQRERLTDYEKNQILAALESPPSEGLLFLAVAGGMYAEGVDYPGEKLSGVFIVSPSLPQVSFERQLLRRYFDEQDESGFEFAYIQPGMTRVIQAAGRLIRSESDRGVVALLCRRFVEEPYQRYLPRDWYDESPEELVTKDPEKAVREFFANG